MDVTEQVREQVSNPDNPPDELRAFSVPDGGQAVIVRKGTVVILAAYAPVELVPGLGILIMVQTAQGQHDHPDEDTAQACFARYVEATEAATTAVDVGGDPVTALAALTSAQAGDGGSDFMVI